MLYGLAGLQQWARPHPPEITKPLARNKTLRTIVQLCRRSVPGKRGVQSVITYNYGDLLEWILGRHPFQSVWKATSLRPRRLPIYHVHGFMPSREGRGSGLDEIELSGDQYHRSAQDPFSWSNLVQMQALSESVGLMIGLSLTDRNGQRSSLQRSWHKIDHCGERRYGSELGARDGRLPVTVMSRTSVGGNIVFDPLGRIFAVASNRGRIPDDLHGPEPPAAVADHGCHRPGPRAA